MSTANGKAIGLSFQARKGYRKDVGKELDPATGKTKYKRFWLGPDEQAALRLAKMIVAEWELILAHGGKVWTAEALDRIHRARHGRAAVAPVVVSMTPAPTVVTTQPVQADAPVDNGLSLYSAIAGYVASVEADAKSGQISEGRWNNIAYAMDRLKLAVPDLPLSQIGYDQIRQIINHFTSRPVSPVTGRKIAPDTVIDTLAFTRALFVRLADQHKWASPMSIDKVFKYNRQKLYTDAELERKAQVQVFTLDELKTLWMGCGKCLYELLFLLGLNCGFTAMEIATLRRAQCHLDGPKPFIRRIRHKTQVKGVWRLWPETADLLRQLMCGENEGDLALRTKTGKPLVHYFGRSRNDAVGHAWDDVRKRVDGILEIREMLGNNVVPVRKLGFKYLRKTGSNLIRRIGGKDCAEVYLAHADKTLSRVYNNRDFKSLSKAIRTMRRQLVPVLGPEASEEEPAQAATVSPA